MFDAIIRSSLRHPWLVILASVLLVGLGLLETSRIPLDVLPELSAPAGGASRAWTPDGVAP